MLARKKLPLCFHTTLTVHSSRQAMFCFKAPLVAIMSAWQITQRTCHQNQFTVGESLSIEGKNSFSNSTLLVLTYKMSLRVLISAESICVDHNGSENFAMEQKNIGCLRVYKPNLSCRLFALFGIVPWNLASLSNSNWPRLLQMELIDVISKTAWLQRWPRAELMVIKIRGQIAQQEL
jgi:hypothetical protein